MPLVLLGSSPVVKLWSAGVPHHRRREQRRGKGEKAGLGHLLVLGRGSALGRLGLCKREKEREGRQLGQGRSWAASVAGSGREREKEVKEVFSFSIFRNAIKYKIL
jgi:hypothetical protein